MAKEENKKDIKKPIKFVLYKRIDEDTGRGEERLRVYVWHDDSEDKEGGRYIERFEKRAAALSRDNDSDPRMQGQTRERILAIMCVDERLYTGAQNMESIVETIPNLRFEQKIVVEDGKKTVKRYRIDKVSWTSVERFRNALETSYNSQDCRAIIGVEEIRGKGSQLEVVLSIPQWNTEQKVVIPTYLIPEKICQGISVGQHYFGRVNIGCKHAKEIYVRNWDGPLPPVSDEEWEKLISDEAR